ncbi:SRPBCC domain-containing protein [Nocardiopsis tropica]
MKWTVGIAATIALIGALMYREKVDERSIEIAAPPEAVWPVLMDFDAYPDWNPMVRRIDGTPAVGNRLNEVQVVNNGSAMSFSPTVLAAEPAREFRWVGRVLIPGLMDGEHYFRLEATATGTRLTQGERFRGVLVPVAGAAIDVGDAFAESNAALRDRVLATIGR